MSQIPYSEPKLGNFLSTFTVIIGLIILGLLVLFGAITADGIKLRPNLGLAGIGVIIAVAIFFVFWIFFRILALIILYTGELQEHGAVIFILATLLNLSEWLFVALPFISYFLANPTTDSIILLLILLFPIFLLTYRHYGVWHTKYKTNG